MREDDLHKEVITFLRRTLPDAAIVHHSPNESKGNVQWYAKRRALGTVTGWPDLEVFYSGKSLFLELKTPQGRVSTAQKQVHECLSRAGFTVAVCRSVDDVSNALASCFGINSGLRSGKNLAALTEK